MADGVWMVGKSSLDNYFSEQGRVAVRNETKLNMTSENVAQVVYLRTIPDQAKNSKKTFELKPVERSPKYETHIRPIRMRIIGGAILTLLLVLFVTGKIPALANVLGYQSEDEMAGPVSLGRSRGYMRSRILCWHFLRLLSVKSSVINSSVINSSPIATSQAYPSSKT